MNVNADQVCIRVLECDDFSVARTHVALWGFCPHALRTHMCFLLAFPPHPHSHLLIYNMYPFLFVSIRGSFFDLIYSKINGPPIFCCFFIWNAKIFKMIEKKIKSKANKLFSSFFSTILLIKFQVRSHLWSHSINTPTRTHFARTIPRGFAPLSHLKYRTHVCDRTSARTHVHTLKIANEI